MDAKIHGVVAPGFEEVGAAFRENFSRRHDVGAACAVYHRGEKVVDIWGGLRDRRGGLPWEEDTLVVVFSTTKGLAAMAMAVAHARGLFEWDSPVASYWAEFAQNGKGEITVRQLMSHQAGLPVLDESLDIAKLADPDLMATILARQPPVWKPGTRRGYHALTLGWYQTELLRRVDPGHRTLGEFFRDEISGPLDLEFHIGLPGNLPERRVARIEAFDPRLVPVNLRKVSPRLALSYLLPRSLLFRAMNNPRLRSPAELASAPYRAVEIPSANGFGEARAIARAYAIFADGGEELGIGPRTMEALTTPVLPSRRGGRDRVVKLDTSYSAGFAKPSPATPFGSGSRSFGSPGLGGSFGFADPEARLGYAYVTNRMDLYFFDDPREKVLRDACYRCLERL